METREAVFNPTKGYCEATIINPAETLQTRHYHLGETLLYVRAGSGKAWLKLTDNQQQVCAIQQGDSIFVPNNAYIQLQAAEQQALEFSSFSTPLLSTINYLEIAETCPNWNIVNNSGSLSEYFEPLKIEADYIAPDNSQCRLLARGLNGSLAHFTQEPNTTSAPVKHSIVEETWQILSGTGQMWLKQANKPEQIIDLIPGTVLTIPVRTAFQFRNIGNDNLTAVAITMPPWPGAHVISPAIGPWEPSSAITAAVNPLYQDVIEKKLEQIKNVQSNLGTNPAGLFSTMVQRNIDPVATVKLPSNNNN